MESLIAALGSYPLIQLTVVAILATAGVLAIRKGSRDSGQAPNLVTEADLLRLRQTINDEQSAARARLYQMFDGLNRRFEEQREKSDMRYEGINDRLQQLAERVTTIEAVQAPHRPHR